MATVHVCTEYEPILMLSVFRYRVAVKFTRLRVRQETSAHVNMQSAVDDLLIMRPGHISTTAPVNMQSVVDDLLIM